jgi:hypothetical protein
MTKFIRGQEPKKAMGIGKEGAYIKKKEGIAKTLKIMHIQFKEKGSIQGLSLFENEFLTRNHTRKLIDMKILKKLTSSKRNMQYEWCIGDDINYLELADEILRYSKKESSSSKTIVNIYRILDKYKVEQDIIPDIIDEIMEII